jgi:hypothetical protein
MGLGTFRFAKAAQETPQSRAFLNKHEEEVYAYGGVF